ncbi:MAG: alpha/beta hydrolase [Gammaproteobacteria bacterium]|nr:alpha/beta hydrolase [Gammaproteobacteria bacterium]
MDSSDGTFQTAGQEIYYRCWQPHARPRAVILLVHGLAEHCGRYEPLARRMMQENIAVCALDLPGHGQSSGAPCHIQKFEQLHNSVSELRNRLAQWYPKAPVFLLGHSMGGLIATGILLRHQDRYAGCILSGPAVRSPLQPPLLQLLVVRLLSVVAPRARVLGLDPAGVSRDPAVVKNYIADPLNYSGKVTARLVTELFSHMQQALDGAPSITLPLLILHGGADSMTAPSGSTQLHDSATSSDKTLKIYDGLYHEIFNEPEGPQILNEVAQWIIARLPS